MKKLEELLKDMDTYAWDGVPNVPEKFKKDKYRKSISEFLRQQMEKADIEFSGSVLDLCCGPVSFGAIWNNVVGYDIDPRFIKILKENGIRGIIGNIRDMPFEDKSFDYVVCSCPLMRSSAQTNLTYEELCSPQSYVNKFVDDCIRIARKKVFIISPPIVKHLPEKHREKIENISETFVVYNTGQT